MPKELPTVKVWNSMNYDQGLLKELRRNWGNAESADFTIVTDKGEIPCHRIVLMSQSLSLKKMIRLLDPPQNRLAIDNFPAHIVEKVLEYMYKGKVDIDIEDMQEMMVVAKYLQLDEFIEWVSDHVDPFVKTSNLWSWRVMAERIDDARVAMYTKREIIKNFADFRLTDQINVLDGVEIGKFMIEFDIERVPKDLLVDATLRWITYEMNHDALEWLTDEELKEIISNITAWWVFEREEKTPEAIRSRTYRDGRCLRGLNIDVAIQKYSDRSMHPFLIKMAQRKAEELAEKRAPQHLKDPPRDTKYTLAQCFSIFKKAFKGYCEKKGEDVDDRKIEEKYDILMGNRKFRLALGPKVLAVIQMRNCTRTLLENLVSPKSLHEFSRLVAESDAIRAVITKALDYQKDRQARAEKFNKESPLRFACIGGDGCIQNHQVNCYASRDGQTLEKLVALPGYIDKWHSIQCAIPNGFISHSGNSNHWLRYDTSTREFTKIRSCPEARGKFALTYHEGRVYAISGMTEKWDWKSTAQYYDLKENQWHELPMGPMEYMIYPSAAGLGKYIYVFAKSEYLCRLHIETHEWSVMKKMPVSVSGGACCTDGKRIWVAGNYSSTTFAYDPDTDEWEEKASGRFKHEHPGLCWHMGLMFMVGGKECKLIEEYNPETDEWTESTMTIPHPTEGMTACVLPIGDSGRGKGHR